MLHTLRLITRGLYHEYALEASTRYSVLLNAWMRTLTKWQHGYMICIAAHIPRHYVELIFHLSGAGSDRPA